jgi:hypothetical protein
MKHFLRYFFLLGAITTYSQVGIGTSLPDESSILDVSSTTQGMLTPRMTSTQIAAIASPATGLLVYDTTLNAFYFYDGTTWVSLGATNTNNDYTGWADYSDTQFTSAAPGGVAANTIYYLPNNAGRSNESQKPIDISTFYDPSTGKILGRDGDGLNVTIEFRLRPITNNDTRVTLGVDIGGTIGEIYTRDFALTRGQNQEHYYLSSFNAYTLGTWAANGGRVRIRATQAVQVYDIRYVLTRTHKAR